jgi:hypothetical protein
MAYRIAFSYSNTQIAECNVSQYFLVKVSPNKFTVGQVTSIMNKRKYVKHCNDMNNALVSLCRYTFDSNNKQDDAHWYILPDASYQHVNVPPSCFFYLLFSLLFSLLFLLA